MGRVAGLVVYVGVAFLATASVIYLHEILQHAIQQNRTDKGEDISSVLTGTSAAATPGGMLPEGGGDKDKSRAEKRQDKINEVLNDKKLPTKGDVNFEPPKNWNPSEPLQKGNRGGYLDKYGREWTQGRSVTKGEHFEWDVQLKDKSHLNVDWSGKITH